MFYKILFSMFSYRLFLVLPPNIVWIVHFFLFSTMSVKVTSIWCIDNERKFLSFSLHLKEFLYRSVNNLSPTRNNTRTIKFHCYVFLEFAESGVNKSMTLERILTSEQKWFVFNTIDIKVNQSVIKFIPPQVL